MTRLLVRSSKATHGPHAAAGFKVPARYHAGFWSRVAKADGCWLWLGPTGICGYGMFSCAQIREGPLPAHRVAYAIAHGHTPAGRVIMHSCDNKICVNPIHLTAGSQGDNTRDAIAKGRWAPGCHTVVRECPRCGQPRRTIKSFRGPCKKCHYRATRAALSAVRCAGQTFLAHARLAPFLPRSYADLVVKVGEHRASIFARHFGLYHYTTSKNLAHVATDMGLSRERCRQIVVRVCEILGAEPRTVWGRQGEAA